MLDNLREDVSAKSFADEEAKFQPAAGTESPRRRSGRFLGMTPIQRFVVAVMFFLSVCVIGALFLLIMGKISI